MFRNNTLYLLLFSFIFFSALIKSEIVGVPGEIIAIQIEDNSNIHETQQLIIQSENTKYLIVPIPFVKQDTVINIKEFPIKINMKDFGESRITIANKSMVTLSKEDSERAYKESLLIKNALNTYTKSNIPSLNFIKPLEGIISSRYGKKRFINEKPRSPHLALDIAAAEGTKIIAPNSGKIILIGNFFYSGKYAVIDHGHGLLSSYSHMSEVFAKEGDIVKQGDKIGSVGSSGRVTGPHLHWSVYLNKVRVNPESLLREGYLNFLLKSAQNSI